MLSGDNGVLQRATDAKEKTVIAQEEENAKLTFTEVQMELAQGKTVESNQFQKIVDGNFGTGNATGTIGGGSYIITVARTGINYQMDSNGNISTLNEVPIDFAPGILEGNGTENNPYVINSVEDLLAFAYNVNSKATSYENEYVTLGRNLDLKDEKSYVDATTKYSLNQYTDNYGQKFDLGYTPDETSNYPVIACMQGCYSGKAFIAVGIDYNWSSYPSSYFKGNFDGCGHYIKNLDSRFENDVGLFGIVQGNVTIKNIGIESGDIRDNGYSMGAGIVATTDGSDSNVIMDNCYNKANITCASAGGIVGWNISANITVTNCYNVGNVIATRNDAGGIIGYYSAFNNGFIENCYNTGNVNSTSGQAGGICSYSGYQYTKNCYNSGVVSTGSLLAGGIVSQFGNSSMNISQCYNFGTVYSGNSEANGIGSNYTGYNETVKDCYNSGNISSSSSTSGACGIITSKKTSVTITNCHNTGNISGTASKSGEIVSTGTVDNTNNYEVKDSNTNANGAIGKTKSEMDEIMSVQNFLNLMNSYVSENNADSTKTKLKTWKLENELPVFDN